jgi:hypothetical protein
VTFREPRTWRGSVRSTDLNREVRDQFRDLRNAVTSLEAGSGGGPTTGILPLGFLMGFAGDSIPAGWLVCDGRYVDKSLYPDLADHLLTTYGSYSITEFALPNLDSRFIVGASAPGDGTATNEAGTLGYTSASTNLTIALTNTHTPNLISSGGGHSHSYSNAHSHNYNHGGDNWSVSVSHGHNNNTHSHGGATTGSGSGNSGAGNLATTVAHAHGINDSNSSQHNAADHGHSGNYNTVNVTSNAVGGTANSSSTQGAHTHTSSHQHDLGHTHPIADRFPEYDEINWLINHQTDTPEDWFIVGSAILGTSLIGA